MISTDFIPGPPQWLTVKEAADRLNMSESGVKTALGRGNLQSFRAPWNGRNVLITLEDLDRYQEWRRTNQPWRFEENHIARVAERKARRLQEPLFYICPRCSVIVDERDQLCTWCERELAGVPYYALRVDVLEPAVRAERCYEAGGVL